MLRKEKTTLLIHWDGGQHIIHGYSKGRRSMPIVCALVELG